MLRAPISGATRPRTPAYRWRMRGLPRPRAPAAMRFVCSASPRAPRPRGYPLRNVGCGAVAVSLRHPALRVCLWLRLEHAFEPCPLRLRRAIALTRLAILWLPGGEVKERIQD